MARKQYSPVTIWSFSRRSARLSLSVQSIGRPMAEEMMNNGPASNGGDRTVEIAGNEAHEEAFIDLDDSKSRASGLMPKIVDSLEHEKRDLIHDNEVKRLKQEIVRLESVLKGEVERSAADKKVLESAAAELEAEVSRLQHDLITSQTEKEGEVRKLKKWAEDLEHVVAKNGVEMERMKKERVELETVKNELEALLKQSERKGRGMENKMAVVIDGDMSEDGDKELMDLEQEWPVVAASTAALATVAALYLLRCARQR